jgi:hypothetical protein
LTLDSAYDFTGVRQLRALNHDDKYGQCASANAASAGAEPRGHLLQIGNSLHLAWKGLPNPAKLELSAVLIFVAHIVLTSALGRSAFSRNMQTQRILA